MRKENLSSLRGAAIGQAVILMVAAAALRVAAASDSTTAQTTTATNRGNLLSTCNRTAWLAGTDGRGTHLAAFPFEDELRLSQPGEYCDIPDR